MNLPLLKVRRRLGRQALDVRWRMLFDTLMEEGKRSVASRFSLAVVLFLLMSMGASGQLIIDPATGQYKDLSYGALTEEGLSLEERTRLFGGETLRYAELTEQERGIAEQDLEALRNQIDRRLVAQCEARIRQWLDRQANKLPPAYEDREAHILRTGAVLFFRAYEMFGEKDYLEAGLARRAEP
ncbi:MAG: hypothetical protein AAF514_17295 [Verrucomicrobiota bacterium]